MARVKAAQQHQGGGGKDFEPQVRHTGGRSNKIKRSQKQIRKKLYTSQAGKKFKLKREHEVNCTCPVCVGRRRAEESTISMRTERSRYYY